MDGRPKKLPATSDTRERPGGIPVEARRRGTAAVSPVAEPVEPVSITSERSSVIGFPRCESRARAFSTVENASLQLSPERQRLKRGVQDASKLPR